MIAKDPRNAERIFPYIGGEEINESPLHMHHRHIVSFGDFPLRRADMGTRWIGASDVECEAWLRDGIVPNDYPNPVAADWPALLQLIEEKVKPERTRKKGNGDFVLRDPLPRRWWQFADKRPALYKAVSGMGRVLAHSQVSSYVAFGFLPSTSVYAHYSNIFIFSTFAPFGVMQSRLHDVWARFFASSLEERLRYALSDCFETFPFPAGVLDGAALASPTTSNQQPGTRTQQPAALESAGREYYDFRAALMVRNDEGLTKTYNRFHDPDERSADILKLRELHAAMDKVVLEAYGWHDLAERATCEFLLDYEDDEDADESAVPARRTRRKPWRYRWPDEFRDEVLARLLDLNRHRAEQERLSGASNSEAETESRKTKRAAKPRKKGSPSDQSELF